MQEIAHGIVCWHGDERRSDRYGSFVVVDETLDGKIQVKSSLDLETAMSLKTKRVRLVAKVVAARQSTHVGDLAYNILPTMPSFGEEVEIGVGDFDLEHSHALRAWQFMLRPGDGRDRLWIDPHKLYRLHDQTIDLLIEETTEDYTPMVDLPDPRKGVISNGDGSFQTKGVTLTNRSRLAPNIRSLGDGMFMFTPPGSAPAGEYIKQNPDAPKTVWDHLEDDEDDS